jgi:cobalamin synthase
VRAAAVIFVASLALAIATALARDPEEPWAVALFIVAIGAAAGAAATWLQLRRPGRRGAGGRGRAGRVRGGSAARRGAEVAAMVALLLWLRAVDGLSLITAAFVLAAFIVAELVLSARPHSSR